MQSLLHECLRGPRPWLAKWLGTVLFKVALDFLFFLLPAIFIWQAMLTGQFQQLALNGENVKQVVKKVSGMVPISDWLQENQAQRGGV